MTTKADFWGSGKPIQLRERLLTCGVPQRAVAREVISPRTGKAISASYFNGVVNRGNTPAGWPSEEAFRADVEAALDRLGVPKEGIWEPLTAVLPGNRQPYQGRRHHWTSKYDETGVEEVNVHKIMLPRDALRHYGLREDPFAEVDDFRKVWLNHNLENIKHTIIGAVDRRSLLAVYGDVGSGKSTILRNTCAELIQDQRVRLIWPDCLNRRELNGDALVNQILRDLGWEKLPRSREERKAAASQALEAAVTAGDRVALVIDEAHDLPEHVLVALKRLWDSAMLFKLLGVVITGQGGVMHDGRYWGLPGLILGSPKLREFAERALLVGIPETRAGQLADYLGWRISRAGSDLDRVFKAEAIQVLAKRTGSLQLANNLAARAMLTAWRAGEIKVTAEAVASV